jgi:hypothetical protein
LLEKSQLHLDTRDAKVAVGRELIISNLSLIFDPNGAE